MNPTYHLQRSKGRGFTLVEAVVSLVVLSLVVLAVVTSLRTFGNTKSVLDRQASENDQVRLVSQFLRSTIGSAMPLLRVGGASNSSRFADRGNIYSAYFGGDAGAMEWAAPASGSARFGGVFLFRLEVERGDLVLRWLPYGKRQTEDQWSDAEQYVLADEVEQLVIRYLGVDGGEWEDEWTGGQSLPVLISLRLATEGHTWPPLTIRFSNVDLDV